MPTYYVVCVNKHTYCLDPHTRIEGVGTNENRGSGAVNKILDA